MFPPQNAEQHESGVPRIEVVTGDAIRDGQGRDEGGVPANVGRVGESFYILFKIEVRGGAL